MKINDVVVYVNVVRFFVKKELLLFLKVKDFIESVFKVNNLKVWLCSLYYIKGVVFFYEMKCEVNFSWVKDFKEFECLVSEVFRVYYEVWNFLLIYFYFLIGEVEVWLVCI